MACIFQATIGEKLAPLNGPRDEDIDINTMITTNNTAVTDAASEIHGKEHRRKSRGSPEIFCDERRDLKKKWYEVEGAKEYRKANKRIPKTVKKAKEGWKGTQCEEIETCLNKNYSESISTGQDLTSGKQGRASIIQDRSSKCPTEEQEIVSRLTECAQNSTTMRGVVTPQHWTAVSPLKQICNRSSVRKLRLQ